MIDGICITLVEEKIIVAATVNVYFLLILVLIRVALLLGSYHVAQFLLLEVVIVSCIIQQVAADLGDSTRHVRQWDDRGVNFLWALNFGLFSLIVIVIFSNLRLNVAKELFDRISAFTTVIKIAAI